MKMQHVTIRTKWFEEEIGFYQEIVGLKIITDMRERGRNLVFLADGPDETKIEIIRIEEEGESGNENLSIGFHAEDVEALREELQAKGLKVSPMVSPSPQVKFFYVTDPAGVKVQFI